MGRILESHATTYSWPVGCVFVGDHLFRPRPFFTAAHVPYFGVFFELLIYRSSYF